MKVLIDECIDQRARHLFSGHDCQTVGHAGFAGMKNGALLAAAEAAGFDVLVTVDQGTGEDPAGSGDPYPRAAMSASSGIMMYCPNDASAQVGVLG